jgi:hypothetical protein
VPKDRPGLASSAQHHFRANYGRDDGERGRKGVEGEREKEHGAIDSSSIGLVGKSKDGVVKDWLAGEMAFPGVLRLNSSRTRLRPGLHFPFQPHSLSPSIYRV